MRVKRFILKSCVVVCLCLMIVGSLQAQVRLPEDPQAYNKQQATILKTLKKDMDKSSHKGDVALDYIEQMTAYYKASSALAQNVMDHGDNQVIRQVGRNIKKRNGAEVKKMEPIKLKLKEEKVKDEAREQEYLEHFKDILEKMLQDLEAVEDDNIDRQFLFQMITYNEGAIKLSENLLEYTPNLEVQEVAKRIIDRHTKEIPYLQKLAKEIRQ